MRIVFLGLSVTSSWGNGHATTYRGLMRALRSRGHEVLFLERDVPWYADNRDLPLAAELYGSLEELRDRFTGEVARADLVIVGSYVPEGVAVGEWVLQTARGVAAFYDIDTPVTLAKLARCDYEYITPALVGRYSLYLSFTGGRTLTMLRRRYGAANARALYCSVDPELYFPQTQELRWDLGYLGTYSDDRQPALDRLLTEPARRLPAHRFVVAGPQYPESICWPENVERIEHLPPSEHRAFYNAQRFTLNVTRQEMVRAGWSPSVRLFEAAACGVPIVSDYWPGLEDFFRPGSEILLCDTSEALSMPDLARTAISARARAVVLARHTSANRAEELERYVLSVYDNTAAHSARVNGYGGTPNRGAHAWRVSESGGRGAGPAISPTLAEAARDLQQPARTGAANGSSPRSGLETPGTGIPSAQRTRLRRVDRTGNQ